MPCKGFIRASNQGRKFKIVVLLSMDIESSKSFLVKPAPFFQNLEKCKARLIVQNSGKFFF